MGDNTVRQAITDFTVFELDDFSCDEASLYALTTLKAKYPSFKATLFTVLGKCDLAKLAELVELDWLEIAVHGNDHATERFWNYGEATTFLNYAIDLGCSMLFKAPWDDMLTDAFLNTLSAYEWSFATRNRLYGSLVSIHSEHQISVYLGCPQSNWLHPFQLDKRIEVPMQEPFLFVSEVFDLPNASESGWVLR